MAAWTTAILLQHALFAADPTSYLAALKDAQVQKRPLLVLVGAEWCPGCQTMKQNVLPAMARRGALKPVSYTTVDFDNDADIARQLLRTGSIPQLIVFSRKPDGKWQRDQIIGEVGEAEVQSLIARALKAQQPPATESSSGAIGN
jgi:thioredoxin-like negative regulator of GroEL